MGGKREGSSRNMYKRHMDKAKGRWDQGWEVGIAGVGGKWRQLYLNNNTKREKYEIKNKKTKKKKKIIKKDRY